MPGLAFSNELISRWGEGAMPLEPRVIINQRALGFKGRAPSGRRPFSNVDFIFSLRRYVWR